MKFRVTGTTFAREDFDIEVEAEDSVLAGAEAFIQVTELFEPTDFEVEFDEFEEVK